MNERKVYRAVIAHPSATERKRIAASLERLGYFAIVGETGDGAKCLELLDTAQPDIVILDVVLSTLDGLGVLESMQCTGVKRLVLTEYTGFAETQAAALGADYCLLMPCSYDQIAQRTSQLLLPAEELLPADQVIDRATRQILQALAGVTRLKGAEDAVVSVRLILQDWNRIHYVTTEIYGEAARRRGAQWKSVDHAIRTLVDRIWTKAPLELLEMYFAAAYPEWRTVRPTNTTFLTAVAQHVSDRVGIQYRSTSETKKQGCL